MTDGIVSAISRDVQVDGRVMNLIQTNAARTPEIPAVPSSTASARSLASTP